MKDSFNQQTYSTLNKQSPRTNEFFDNKIIKFPESNRNDYCSNEEVGYWVDRLLKLPEDDELKSAGEMQFPDLAEVLIQKELV